MLVCTRDDLYAEFEYIDDEWMKVYVLEWTFYLHIVFIRVDFESICYLFLWGFFLLNIIACRIVCKSLFGNRLGRTLSKFLSL